MAMRLERILLGNPAAAGPSRIKRLKVDITVGSLPSFWYSVDLHTLTIPSRISLAPFVC
jgi:hypothetical protein